MRRGKRPHHPLARRMSRPRYRYQPCRPSGEPPPPRPGSTEGKLIDLLTSNDPRMTNLVRLYLALEGELSGGPRSQ